jgi:hypothetical protein
MGDSIISQDNKVTKLERCPKIALLVIIGVILRCMLLPNLLQHHETEPKFKITSKIALKSRLCYVVLSKGVGDSRLSHSGFLRGTHTIVYTMVKFVLS